jgi:DNA-binding MarR family transcriptional regulator
MTHASLSLDAIHQIRDECLCLATQRAARLLARRFDRVFAPLGLTNGQFSMMVSLSGRWVPRLGELAGFLAMDQATVTAATKTLERRGWVMLCADDTDARIRRPRLTDAGRNVVARAVPLWQAEHARLQQGLPEQNAAALAQILAQLG